MSLIKKYMARLLVQTQEKRLSLCFPITHNKSSRNVRYVLMVHKLLYTFTLYTNNSKLESVLLSGCSIASALPVDLVEDHVSAGILVSCDGSVFKWAADAIEML